MLVSLLCLFFFFLRYCVFTEFGVSMALRLLMPVSLVILETLVYLGCRC